MTFANVLDILVTGLILGGLYALIAVGLSLQYGVVRVLNVAHGEFIMIGAFLTLTLFTQLGITPFFAGPIVGSVLLVFGYLIHITLFQYLRDTSPSMDIFSGRSLLASFGILFILQNLMLIIWGSSVQGYSFLRSSVSIFGAAYSANRLLALGLAIVATLAFYVFIRRTRPGKAIRAAAEDPAMAQVLGVDIRQLLAFCFGLGAFLAGLAGVLISMTFELQPSSGLEYTIIAIVVVVFGGLGSITGSLVGGFILGLFTSLVNFIDPSLSLITFYLIFMILLLVRPSGILGKEIHD
jgi:branched-chain amino acid transport system permease protein